MTKEETKGKRKNTESEEEEPKKPPSKKSKTESKSKHPHHDGSTHMTVHKEDFYHYVNFRILDSIGYPGAYRKFMLCRWDILMRNHIHTWWLIWVGAQARSGRQVGHQEE